MKPKRKEWSVFIVLLVLAAGLRFSGWSRGESDFAPESSAAAANFYHFHPDEETLVRAALRLRSLFEPPLTAYGTLPMLLGRGVLEASGLLCAEPLTLEGESRAFIIQTVRLCSGLVSLATVALVFWLGRRHWGWEVGAWAGLFVAVAPVAVQQAHFFTIDGLFALLALLALAAGLEALASDRREFLITAGALVGLAAATRLNGLLLGAVVALGFLLGPAFYWRGAAARLKLSDLCLAGLAAAVVLVALQPYLITRPEILLREGSSDDFGFSLKVARGEILTTWSMADTHTRPYWHYLTHLWPQAIGWPLTAFFALGFAWGLWRRHWAGLVLAGWCGLYFFTIGGIHTKHVRYLLPLLSGLSLLAGVLAVELHRRWRYALVPVVLIGLHATAYGVAFAGIYRVEDSRIQAGRWIVENVPAGQNIALETGGFSLQGLVAGERYGRHFINSTRLFTTHGYLLCDAGAEYLQGKLSQVQYIALTDVNRYRQYAEVPRLRPVLHDFYTRLFSGELGFGPKMQFKVSPGVMGFDFGDDWAEPSFYGYDHPTVHILERSGDFDTVWARWRDVLLTDQRCADSALAAVAALVRDGDLERSETKLNEIATRYPHVRLTELIMADLQEQLGRPQQKQRALERYALGYQDQSLRGELIPWAAGSSLVELGLPNLVRLAMVDGFHKHSLMSQVQRAAMARSYLPIASRLARGGQLELAAEVYEMSALIDPQPTAYNALAALAHRDLRRDKALSWWQASLELEASQVDILRLAGRTAYHLGRGVVAISLLARAAELDPKTSPEQKVAEYRALAAEAEQLGERKKAAELQAMAQAVSR